MQPESRYKAYILRVWQAENEDKPTVFATLEDCRTGEHRAFASPAALMAFLEAERADPRPEKQLFEASK